MKLYVNEIVRTNNFEDDDIMNKILGMWDTFYKNNDDYKGVPSGKCGFTTLSLFSRRLPQF